LHRASSTSDNGGLTPDRPVLDTHREVDAAGPSHDRNGNDVTILHDEALVTGVPAHSKTRRVGLVRSPGWKLIWFLRSAEALGVVMAQRGVSVPDTKKLEGR